MIHVVLFALETARTASGIQLYAREGSVAIHLSARFFVVYVRKVFQTLALALDTIVEIVPVALFDKLRGREHILAQLFSGVKAVRRAVDIHIVAVANELVVYGRDLTGFNEQFVV
jgi:hypothetical protein